MHVFNRVHQIWIRMHLLQLPKSVSMSMHYFFYIRRMLRVKNIKICRFSYYQHFSIFWSYLRAKQSFYYYYYYSTNFWIFPKILRKISVFAIRTLFVVHQTIWIKFKFYVQFIFTIIKVIEEKNCVSVIIPGNFYHS